MEEAAENGKESSHSAPVYGMLHRTARFFLCAVSILITEMRVPSLSLSPGARKLILLLLPVSYSHKYNRNKSHVKMVLITIRVIQ